MPSIGQSTLLQSLGWAILNSLWQLAFLWVIYQVVFSIYRTAGPDKKSRFASTLLFTGFAWFLYTLFSHWIAGVNGETIFTSSYQEIKGYAALDQWLHKTLPAASLAYLLLLILPVFRFIRNYKFVQQLRHNALHKIHVDWRMFVKKISVEMGIKKPVHIWISDLVTSPVTIGYLKPMILVPLAAVNHLTPQQLEAILLHELSHIRRHDYLINLFITFIQTILYFNPFVNLFVKVIEREREKSCDEAVMHYQYDPHGYASALLLLERSNKLQQPVIAMAAAGKKYDLLSRIETILGVQKNSGFSFNKIAGVFAGLLCIIALNALFIFSKPAKSEHGQFAFMQLTNPYYFFAGKDADADHSIEPTVPSSPVLITNNLADISKPPAVPAFTVVPPSLPATDIKNSIKENELAIAENIENIIRNDKQAAAFIPVSLVNSNIPELNNQEEEQVKEAVEASKIVLEKAQWEQIEKNIADVMTAEQKDKARSIYMKEVNKVNWKQLEDRLKVSYNEMDWNKVNAKLNTAIAAYQIDSIQQSLNNAISSLNKIESLVVANQSQEIIHPEICLDSIRLKKLEIKQNLEKLKAIKTRKIVQL